MLAVNRPTEILVLSGQLQQELYDPAAKLTRPEFAAAHGQEFYSFIGGLYGVGEEDTLLLTSLACDAVESGQDEEGLLERARAFDAEDLIAPSLEQVMRAADEQALAVLERIPESVPSDRRTLAACDQIAQVAYEGKFRATGRPYYTHPQESAAMGYFAFKALESEGYDIDPELKDSIIARLFLHDATEETVRSCKYYDPNRPESFSPLMVRYVFNHTGSVHGKATANSLRLMTHYAKQPWAPDYPDYILLGSNDLGFCLTKATEMRHNEHMEPKPITDATPVDKRTKILDKRSMYRAAFQLLSINAPGSTEDPSIKAWARRYFDIIMAIEPEDIPGLVDDLTAYIYGPGEADGQMAEVEIAS